MLRVSSITLLIVAIIMLAGSVGTTVKNNVKAAATAAAFRFNSTQFSECITDVTPMFVEGYYAAHTDFRTGGPYNETIGAPPASQNYYYNMMTGEKIPDEGARNDYIQGYQLGWKDAQRGVFQVDC